MICRNNMKPVLCTQSFIYTVFERFISSSKGSKSRAEKAMVIRRLRKENQLLFGDLLETSKERAKRLEPNTTAGYKDTQGNVEGDDEPRRQKQSVASGAEIKISSKKTEESRYATKRGYRSVQHADKAYLEHTEVSCIIESKPESKSLLNSRISQNSTVPCMKQDPVDILHSATSCDELNDQNTVPLFPLYNPGKMEFDRTFPGIYPSVTSGIADPYPSVTTILQYTMSDAARMALERWKANLIAELGEEGFQKFNKTQLLRGKLMHDAIQKYLLGVPREDLIIKPELEGCWKSLELVFPLVSDIKMLEAKVSHPQLKYKGILDCVAVYRDKPVIVEWKKSEKMKSTIGSTYDYPIQIVAYMGALNYDINYPFKVDEGLLVIAYNDGSRADVHHLGKKECEKYWGQWISKVEEYYRKRS